MTTTPRRLGATDMLVEIQNKLIALEQSHISKEARIVFLESWTRNADLTEVRRAEQFKAMDERFNRLELQLSKVVDTLSRIMWLVISGIIMAFVAFMISGGLSNF